jgi:hypothetical protein
MESRSGKRLLFTVGAWLLPIAVLHAADPAKAPRGSLSAMGIPVVFEENRGQAPSDVRFVARSSGLTVHLRRSDASFRFRSDESGAETSFASKRLRQSPSPVLRPAVSEFTLSLRGTASATSVEGLDPLPGHSNYLRGNDPTKWITDVPQFARVRYRNVYPGIDQIYHGAQRKIEYDLVVAPGADPSPILLEIGGGDSLEKTSSGHVIARMPNGALQHRAPIAYQENDDGKTPVDVDYALQGNGRIALLLGKYDRTLPLVIDPVVDYSTYLGGSRDDEGSGIGVDAAGSVYVTGHTLSADFPVKFPLQSTLNDNDAFVTKINAAGDAIVYSTFFGGSDYEQALAIAVLPDGRTVIGGQTQSHDLPLLHAIQSTLKGQVNGFVAELNAQGNGLVFSTYLGGRTQDRVNALAVDALGNVYAAGEADSPDFPSTATITSCSLGYNGFVSKLSPDGSRLLYSVCVGGETTGTDANSPGSWFSGIAVDQLQQVYVVGTTINIDFPAVNAAQAYRIPVVAGAHQQVAVAAKLNAAGNALLYSTYIGGAWESYGRGIGIDSAGNAYIGGITLVQQCQPGYSYCDQINFPLVDPADPDPHGGDFKGYVVKLSPIGDKFLYATFVPTCLGATSEGVVAVDDFGNAYIGMYTNCAGDMQHSFAAVAKIGASGNVITNYPLLGTGGASSLEGIALDGAANVYITGYTYPGGIPLVNPIQPNAGLPGLTDAFIAKLHFDSVPSSVSVASSVNPAAVAQPVTFTVTFPGPGRVQLLDGGTVLSEVVPLANAVQTTFTLATLAAGDHAITAVFVPASSAPIISAVLMQHVVDVDCQP